MNKKYLTVIIMVAALVFSGVFLFRQNDDKEEKEKGIILTLGERDPINNIGYNVIELALEQRGGSINGIEIEIQTLGDYDNISDPNIIGIIGLNSSGISREIIPLANAVKVPVISHLATWPGLTKAGFAPGEPGIYYPNGQRNFFRTVPSDDQQGAAAALWLSQQDMKRVYIFSNENVYSQGLSGVFEAGSADFDFEIVGHDSINIENLDPDMELTEVTELMMPYIESILDAEPDALFFPVSGVDHPYVNVYLNAILEKYPDLVIIGGDGLAQIPLNIQGIFATDVVPTFAITSEAETFRQDYQSKYGTEPPSWALSLYDGTNAFFDAVERAGKADPQLIIEELKSFEQFDGTLGTWNFDQNGDINLNSISLRQFQEGTWEFVETIR